MNKNLKTILLGIGAGSAIGFGGLLNIFAKTVISNAAVSKLVGSLLFPIGLTLVCYLGLNLFTGKIGYLLENKHDFIGFLGLVYLGNIIGAVALGLVSCFAFKNVPDIYNVALKISVTKCGIDSFRSGVKILAGSILCGALVYIAVFCYKTFKHHVFKVLGIFIAIAIFVYFGFDHCVANMFYFSFSLSFDDFHSYLNILLATLGNSVGAILFNEIIKFIFKLKNEKDTQKQ